MANKNCSCRWGLTLNKYLLALIIPFERKEIESERNDKVKFFIYGFKINNLVGDSLFFVVVFILDSLEEILMAKLLIELGLVANEVASLYLFSY